jgi:hypothetical protein
LVSSLIHEWRLGAPDSILDPFCGAGTTIVTARAEGVPAVGRDLSPLAAFVTRTKIRDYLPEVLRDTWRILKARMSGEEWQSPRKSYPSLLRQALPGRLLAAFEAIGRDIDETARSDEVRDFFRLALLAVLPRYSRAVRSGGWLRWIKKRANVCSVVSVLDQQIGLMLRDLDSAACPKSGDWRAEIGDARRLPDAADTYSAIITSPPYPNRHDYTRVFGVELMLAFVDCEAAKRLRYQSFHSHPEARPTRPEASGYQQPPSLKRALAVIKREATDTRIPAMLDGYFLDMFLCLAELKRVAKAGAKLALVVGNARYCGQTVLVDRLTAELGQQVGLRCNEIIAVRFRGNSAQQMGKYGRSPSRESIVVFEKPAA